MAEDNKRWGIVYCPKTGVVNPKKKWARIEKCLKEKGVSYDHVQSESSKSVERLVKMMINNGYTTIIIVGGDSALNEAVNCLMHTDREVREQITLGVIPNGTMNDFARFWDFRDTELEDNIERLVRHRVRKVDIGCIRYTNQQGERCRRYFLNCICIGLVASVMNLRRRAHGLLGALSFIPSSLLMIFQRLEYKMRLRIESDVIDRKVMTVCIGNARGCSMCPWYITRRSHSSWRVSTCSTAEKFSTTAACILTAPRR